MTMVCSPRSIDECRLSLKRFHYGFLSARMAEWVYLVTLNWMVLVLFKSASAVGVVNACRLIPVVLVSVPSGILADRYSCRKLLSLIYLLAALFTFGVGWALVTKASLTVLCVMVFLRELVAGMEPPARNLFLSELCPQELPRALASNASVLNLGRVVGPSAAGYLLVHWNLPGIFALASVGTALCALSTFCQPETECSSKRATTSDTGMREALSYVAAHPRLKLLIALMVAPMILAFPYLSMLPMFAKELIKCGPEGVGTLVSLTAVGSLVSSATIIGNSQRVLKGSFQIVTLLLFSASLLVGFLAPNFAVAAVAMFVAGGASQAYRTVSRILAQMGVPKKFQGRVVSLILMDRALIPVGTLLLGWWAEHFSLLSSGVLMAAGTAAATLALLVWKPALWAMSPVSDDASGLVVAGKVLTPGPA